MRAAGDHRVIGRGGAGLLRGWGRGVLLVAVSIGLGVPQAVWQFVAPRQLPGPLPALFHRLLLRILGLRIEIVGTPLFVPSTVWVGNHLSYLDIPVLGSLGPMRFVAKQEIAGWPLFGWLANLQRTVYISRRPRDAAVAAAGFADAVKAGGVVVLFPEGTSSDGTKVLAFRPSLMEVLMSRGVGPTEVQGFTLRLQAVDGRSAAEPHARDLYAYHGDMSLLPHLRAFLRVRGARLQLIFHPPVAPCSVDDRRQLAARLHDQVAWGLAHGQSAP